MDKPVYSKKNPPPVKVGDLLYLYLEDESGFGIVYDVYEKRNGKFKEPVMKVYWSNAHYRVNKIQEHDINRVEWNFIMEYYGQ